MATRAALINDRYRVVRRLGRGPFSQVLLVRDLRLREPRALKMLPRDAAAPGLRRVLAREFSLLAGLAHPAIAAVYDLEVLESLSGTLPMPGRFEGSLFFTEELVPGPDVGVLTEVPPPERYQRVLRVALHLADALGYLHQRGLCHRDIKPSNVLLREEGREQSSDPDRIVLIDLGLAAVTHGSDAAVRALRAAAGQLPPTASDTGVAGSLAYMAPEALYGEGGARADLYSVGATLFELCTGAPPFGSGATASGATASGATTSGATGSGSEAAPGGLQRLVHAILEDAAPSLAVLAPDVPDDLAGIIDKLLRKRPEDRYSGVDAFRDDLRRALGDYWQVDGGSGADVPPGDVARATARTELVGRGEVLALLQETFRDGGANAPAVAVVRGAPGVGKTRLLRELKQWAQLTTAADLGRALVHAEGSLPDVVSALRRAVAAGAADSEWVRALDLAGGSGEGDAERVGDELRAQRALRGLASFLLGVAVRAPFFVRITGDDPGAAYELAVALARGLALAPESGEARNPFLVAFEATDDALPPEAVSLLASTGALVDVPLAPLSRNESARLAASVLRRELAPAEEASLWRSTAGNPLLVIEQARDPDAELPGTVEDVIRRRFHALQPGARSVLVALAAWDLPVTPTRLEEIAGTSSDAVAEALTELVGRGWCEVGAGEAGLTVRILGTTLARGVLEAERSVVLQKVAARCVRLLLGDAGVDAVIAGGTGDTGDSGSVPGGAERAARLLRLAGDVAGARRVSVVAAEQAVAQGRLADARSLLQRALESGAQDKEAAALQLRLADVCLARGEYDEGLRFARAASPQLGRSARVLAALLLRRRGPRDEALASLEAEVDASPERDDIYWRLQAARARLWVDGGEASRVLAELPEPEGEASTPGAVQVLEILGLAQIHLGDFAAAGSVLSRALAAADSAGDRIARARCRSLLGMVASQGGETKRAAEAFAAALADARSGGDTHGAATYAINLGATLMALGDYGGALRRYQEGVRTLEALGGAGGYGSALYNYGALLLLLGDVRGAETLAARAASVARARQDAGTEAYARLLRADVVRRRGDVAGTAGELYTRAAHRLLEMGDRHGGGIALAAAGGAAVTRGDRDAALAALGELRDLVAAAPELPVLAAHADELSARLALAADPPEPARALEYLARAAECYVDRAADRDELWRVLVLRARAHAAAGDDLLSRRAAREARQVLELLSDAVPEVHQEQFWHDAEKAWVVQRSDERRAGAASLAQPGADPGELGRYRRLASIAKRLNGELDTARLLEQIVDSVIDLLGAERGFLLLLSQEEGADGSLDVAVARGIDLDGAAGTDGAISRSIAEQVARSGDPLVTVDAASDVRFDAAQSVHALRLRSVIAVPLRVRGRVAGTVYVDNRLRRGAFTERDVELVSDFADIAAIALENARLHREHLERGERIAELNEELRKRVRSQEQEIRDAREELRLQRGALETRYDYSNIVGRSRAMQQLFHLLDRVTTSSVSVLLTGESGTGKELVAKAIHYNGSRSDRNFVSENCAAIPETLLESALFGHVRGAFTGADRDKKGLFELAHTGTLFLDEIGEMSLGMQSRLLRVLQEGELRRVGGQKIVKVDVRVIAATNKDLRRMVAEGTFREDLYYRLAVLHVNVPPLRERREDVPLLCQHFIEKYAEGRVLKVDRRVMASLVNYPWPGNVRELENEVMRACVLAEEVLSIQDLSPAIAAREDAPAPQSGKRTIKEEVAALERHLILDALRHSGGNQTRAAKELGLSRFGLQKKVKRYGLEI